MPRFLQPALRPVSFTPSFYLFFHYQDNQILKNHSRPPKMAGFRAVAVFGLTVKPGDKPTAPFDLDAGEFPATFRITMAAIDPTAKPALGGAANGETLPRATLKMIRLPYDGDSEDDDNDESFNLEDMLDDEASESDSDGEVNGGPSDPQKSPKARRKAAVARIKEDLAKNDFETEHDGINGTENKGKGKATELEEDSDQDDGDEEEEEFVLCTLDPSKVCSSANFHINRQFFC